MPADPPQRPNVLVEGRDYTVDPAGHWVFTRSFLLARGRCCGSGCRNCPYTPAQADRPIDAPAGQR